MRNLIKGLLEEEVKNTKIRDANELDVFVKAVQSKVNVAGLELLPVSTLKKMAKDLTGKKLADLNNEFGVVKVKQQVRLRVHTTKKEESGVYVDTAGTILGSGQNVGGVFLHVGAIRQTISDLKEAIKMLEDRGFEV